MENALHGFHLLIIDKYQKTYTSATLNHSFSDTSQLVDKNNILHYPYFYILPLQNAFEECPTTRKQ